MPSIRSHHMALSMLSVIYIYQIAFKVKLLCSAFFYITHCLCAYICIISHVCPKLPSLEHCVNIAFTLQPLPSIWVQVLLMCFTIVGLYVLEAECIFIISFNIHTLYSLSSDLRAGDFKPLSRLYINVEHFPLTTNNLSYYTFLWQLQDCCYFVLKAGYVFIDFRLILHYSYSGI